MSIFRDLQVHNKLQELRQNAKFLEISNLSAGKRTRKFFEQIQDDVASLAEHCATQALILQGLLTYLDEKGGIDTARFQQIVSELEAPVEAQVAENLSLPILGAGEPTVKLPKPKTGRPHVPRPGSGPLV